MSLKKLKSGSAIVKTTSLDSKPTRALKADSWENVISGLGVLGSDKRTAAMPVLCLIGWDQAEILWRGDDMAARIIETVPYEETREGFELVAEDEGGEEEQLAGAPEDKAEEEAEHGVPEPDAPDEDQQAPEADPAKPEEEGDQPGPFDKTKPPAAQAGESKAEPDSKSPSKEEPKPGALGEAPPAKPEESPNPEAKPGEVPAKPEAKSPPFGAKPVPGATSKSGQPSKPGAALGVPPPPAENDDLEKLFDGLMEMKLLDKLYEARTYARAYGGGAWLLGVDDGQRDMSKPLNPEAVRQFDWINVLHPRELQPYKWYDDAMAPKYGEIELYFLVPDTVSGGQTDARTPGVQIIHESRIVRFDGIVVSKRQRREGLQGWGDSVLTRCYEVIRDFQSSWSGAAVLMSDFAQTVFKMKGLADLVASEDPADAQAFRARVRAIDYSRSVTNSVLIDADGEDFERKSTTVAGFPDLLDKFGARLAAAARMPLTKLMGVSPGGLNATGDSDTRNWYDEVRAEQNRKLTPIIKCVGKLKAKAMGLKLPEKWDVRWKPLWQLDEGEEADRRLKIVQMAVAAITAQMITPEEAAVSIFGGAQFSADIKLADKDRTAFAEERVASEQEAQQLNMEVAKAGAKAGGGGPPGTKPFGGKPDGGGFVNKAKKPGGGNHFGK